MKKSRKNIKKNKRNSSRISKFRMYGGMKLNVETHLEGIDVTLNVEPTDTIQSIKSKVIAKIGAQPNNFYKLTYNDRVLFDRKTIADYGIPENSNLMFRRHRPGFKLTEEERAEGQKKYKFGLCDSCDNPLDDRADWVPDPGVGMMCHACNAYYTEGETDGYVDGSNGDDPTNRNLMLTRHTPGFKLTEEERDEEHKKHKFGLCGSCDNPLDDRADWVSDPVVGLMCHACNAYYTEGETDGYTDGINGDDHFDIEHFCNSTMWSKNLKIGDRVITCGESIYSKVAHHEAPVGTIGTIVSIGHRYKDTVNPEIQYKVKFDGYPHILEDMEHLYWCHNLRPY
jgi:hypothetical protein